MHEDDVESVSAGVSVEDVLAAGQLLAPVVHHTPIQHSAALSAMAGALVQLKCENLQRSGSFKIRGAYVRLARLSAAERRQGVIAASAGNHAQGVALAARELGIDATVYMPVDAALPKIAATEEYGARVELVGSHVGETIDAAQAAAAETGAVFIHPFDHPDVIAGQGTVALEILEDVPTASTVLIPVGGGGLLAGCAVALRALRPDVRIIGVQAERAAAYPQSLRAGRPVAVDDVTTMADGIAVARPGDIPFELIADAGCEIVTVSEADISRALLLSAERAKLIVEPAGVVAVAAIMSGQIETRSDGPIVGVLSGGNIDPIVLLRILRHGLSWAGRFVQLRIRLKDKPGALADLMAHIANEGANVMHVGHVRAGVELDIDEVELGVQLETKGPAHCQRVITHLATAGYGVIKG